MTQKTSAMFHFRKALFAKKGIFIEAMIVTIVVNLLGLATAIYSMQVYDRVIPNHGIDTLLVLSIGVLLAIIIDLVLKQSRSMLVDKASKEIDTELSTVFFAHAMSIRMDKRPPTVGTFASQIRAFEFVRQFLTSTTLFVLADIPFALLFIVVIFFIAGPLSLIPLLFLPITILVGVMFIIPVARLSMANAQESNVKNGLLIESIDGIESIKSLQAQNSFQNRWLHLTKIIGENDLALKKWTGLSSHLSQFIQQLSYIGLVTFGVYLIIEGNLTMGGLIAVTIIGGRALSPLSQVANVIVQWQQAKAALVGLDSMMQTPIDGVEASATMPLIFPDHCDGEIELKLIKFGYDTQFQALQINQLKINTGERIAIVGGIGSGKSTLLKLLSGLYLPNEGRVFIDGVDTAHLNPLFMRQHIYYVPQKTQLFNGSLKDNLLLGLENDQISDSDVLEAAKLTGLSQLITAHPRGLGLMISEGGRGLSGGQQQLVALTQLILRIKRQPPKLLLLDEPTSALDGASEMNIMQLLMNLVQKENTTMLFVTHKFSQLNHAERIMVIDKGTIIADGAKAEILPKLSGAKS